ncbi:MAG: hypothetical protein J6B51_01710, partial [Clostridia bacterium]|nr:hypothetical protein [Clostridia bacterium]
QTCALPDLKIPTVPRTVFQYVYTVFITLIGWTVFYFTDFGALISTLSTMFGLSGASFNDIFIDSVIKDNAVLLIVSLVFAFPLSRFICKKIGDAIKNENIFSVLKTVFTIAAIFVSTALLAGNSYNPFLYFRF